ELTLFFDQSTSREMRHVFSDYVHQYLLQRALPDTFNVRYILTCNNCDTAITAVQIERRKARNFDWLPCPVCETRISLIEHELYHIAKSSSQTQKMDQAADKQREHETAQSILQGKIETKDFDVFLCHNVIDKPFVKQIGEQLKEQGILPWLDEWELRPGFPWQKLLGEQIEHIKSAAVFVVRDGIGPWQDLEMMAFVREFVGRDCPVIPVLLVGADKEPKLPPLLGSMSWVDFRLQDPDPLQQLLWGITGKRPDEMYRNSPGGFPIA